MAFLRLPIERHLPPAHAYRVNLPVWEEVASNESDETIKVLVPTELGPEPQELELPPWTIYVRVPDELAPTEHDSGEDWYKHLDRRYPQHAGYFRPKPF